MNWNLGLTLNLWRSWLDYQRRYLYRRYRQGVTDDQARFLAADGLIKDRELLLLYKLAAKAAEGCIVEIGTFHGKSTLALAFGTQKGARLPVFAIDPYVSFVGPKGGVFGPAERAGFFKNMLWSGAAEWIAPLHLPSAQIARSWDTPVSILWIDGDHSYRGVRQDWDSWLPHLTPGARIAFHDSLDPQMGVLRLIQEITADGKFQTLEVIDSITVLTRNNDRSNATR